MLGEDRRILAPGRRLKAIAEAHAHDLRRGRVEVDVDPAAAAQKERAQIVHAVGMVGMFVGVEDAVEPIDLGIEKLLAQIRRSVDQDARDPAVVAAPLDKERRASAAVLRIVRIAHSPAQRRPRDAAG